MISIAAIKRCRQTFWGIWILFAGCMGASLSAHFYGLSPMTDYRPVESEAALSKETIIVIGPVAIPEHLNRPQIVTQTGNGRFEISESHRWAGSLQENILNILTENLSLLLGSDRIMPFPWDDITQPDIKISVSVHRFEGIPGGKAVLGATWSMRAPKNRKAPEVKKTLLEEPVADSTYPAYVSAQSRLLAAFTRELASEILKYRSQ